MLTALTLLVDGLRPAEGFGDHRPARATVRADLLLEGLVVEIQATAVVPG